MGKHLAQLPRSEMRDEEVAVLAMQESEYNDLLRRGKPFALHTSWAVYGAWVEQCVKKGIDRGWPVQVYEGTAIGVDAFCYVRKRDIDTSALCAYAVELHRRQVG